MPCTALRACSEHLEAVHVSAESSSRDLGASAFNDTTNRMGLGLESFHMALPQLSQL